MLDTLPKAIPVRTKEVDGQVLIHDEANRNIHVFNQTAAEILRLCDGNHSLDAMVDALAADADVPKEMIRGDVERMLVQFNERGLLEHAG